MKVRLTHIAIALMVAGCHISDKKIHTVSYHPEILFYQYDSIQKFVVPNLMNKQFLKDWSQYYRQQIIEYNKEFNFEAFDSAEYLIIPALVITASKIEKNNTNILSYINLAELTIKNGFIYLLERDSLAGIIQIDDRLHPLDFNSYLKKRNISILKSTDLFFSLQLKTNTGYFYFPGIVFYAENEFKYITMENEIFPLSEMINHSFKSEEAFRKYINKQIEENKE